jgi:uncharacterized protein
MAADAFWDTSGFFALLNRDDPAHERARKIVSAVRSERYRALTSSWVVGETCTLLVARRRAHMVPRFLDYLQSSRVLHCVHPDETHFGAAALHMRKHLDQGYSFVDNSTMVLMKTLGVRSVVTTDVHFVTAGFDAVLLS